MQQAGQPGEAKRCSSRVPAAVAPYLEIGQQAGAGAQRWVVNPPEADAAHESCHLTPAAE